MGASEETGRLDRDHGQEDRATRRIPGGIRNAFPGDPHTVGINRNPQGLGSAQKLAFQGLPVELVYLMAKHRREIWGSLQVIMQKRQIRLPPDKKLRAQLLSLVVVTTATGWRQNSLSVVILGIY